MSTFLLCLPLRVLFTTVRDLSHVPVSRLECLFDLGGGILLHPFVRCQDEGRALAAVGPVAAPLSVLVRRWPWPMVRRWGTQGEGPDQFQRPRSVTISPGGNLVVNDFGNNRVVVCRPDGTFEHHFGTRGVEAEVFDSFWTLAVSSTNEVFAVGFHNGWIQVFDLDGTFVRRWGNIGEGPGQFSDPRGLAVHGDLVLVADGGNHRIQCFGLDGTFVHMWGSAGDAPGQFNHPRGLAVSSAGEVFVCDSGNSRVQVFDLDGTFRRCWGSAGHAPGQFHHPHDITVSSSGEVLVSDAMRVQVFAADGTFLRGLHLPAGSAAVPGGLVVTPAGEVVVCDPGNHCLYAFPVGA